MALLKIYTNNDTDAISISNIFIDEYMKDANDAQLKIYLYLMRIINANLLTSVSDIADEFNHTEKDVLRALRYWEKKQLLSLEYDEGRNLTGIRLLEFRQSGSRFQEKPMAHVVPLSSKYNSMKDLRPDIPASVTSVSALPVSAPEVIPIPAAVPQPAVCTESYSRPAYSPDQLRDFRSNRETSQLLFIVEEYMGKPLSQSEMQTILFITDRLGFSVDLVDHLIQYCLERGKKDFRYIEKVALSWAQNGITTPAQAQEHSYKYEKAVYDIMKALGKNSVPTSREAEYARCWTRNYGMDMEVILEACARTVLATDTHRFEYADSILSSWFKSGVHHKADIDRVDAAFKRSKAIAVKPTAPNKFNQFQQNSYDFDVLEQELLSN